VRRESTEAQQIGLACWPLIFLPSMRRRNRTHKEVKRLAEREMLPKLGKCSIHDLTKHDVIGIVARVADWLNDNGKSEHDRPGGSDPCAKKPGPDAVVIE
jgi:hypothetical protein